MFVFLILIFSITAVSATENSTDIQTISESENSSIIGENNNLQISPYIVEDIDDGSHNNDGPLQISNINEDIDDGSHNNDGPLQISNINEDNNYQSRSDDLQGVSNTYSNLQKEVNNTQYELNITQDYVFNNATDSNYTNGVPIVNKTNFVINGNGHSIDGNNQARMFSAVFSNVTINNLVFINGNSELGAGLFSMMANITLNNVTFENMKSESMGALSVLYGKLSITDSSFTNITGGKGGIVFTQSATTEIRNCDFENAEVDWSAVYVSNAEAIIENTRFSNIISNYSTAIFASNTNATINNSKFTNLTSKKTSGAIGAKADFEEDSNDTYELTITNSEFTNTISAKNGGSLYFDNIDNVNIINSTFTNSSSEFGGAIVQLEGNLAIENSNFTQNAATFDGGAIYTSYVNLTLNNVNFINNRGLNDDGSRGANGGSLFLDMTNATIINSNFINNTATINGGAIYTYDSSLFMNGTYFTNNSQFNTTGIYSAFDKNYTAINCNFTEDTISLNNTIYATIVDGTGVTLTLLNNTITVTNLPSRFNLKDFGWVSSVKDQGDMGSCWAFGTCGSLESALLKATEVEYDFSENNVQNTMLKYSIYGNMNMSEGGEYYLGVGYLVNWFGMFPTEYDSYDQLGKISALIATDEDIHIQDVIMIHPRQNATDNNQLKEALIKYGALWVAYNATQSAPYYNENTSAQYFNNGTESNHAVTLVGWDDNYSKNNFLITPPGDGAFIIKNSWGSNYGDNGYLYISYYDTGFVRDSCAYGVIFNNTVPYNKNYQVDINGIDTYVNFNQSQVWYANQFEALSDDLIAAVGTYFNNSGENYEISIYVNDELKLTQSGVSAFGGFSTIKLNTYIPIKEGDIFKAVINGVNVPLSTTTRVHNDGNTSFISLDGKTWNVSDNLVSLKIYTVEDSIESSDLVKYYKNDSKFSVNINVANTTVTFNINGVNYTRTSDVNGTASIAINLRPGEYNITTFFNGISKTNKITVLSTIIADNLVKYYQNGSEFYAKFLNNDGTPLANTNVTFNINGVFYTRTTDTNGTAKLNLNLRPGNYTLTAIDPKTGLETSYNITILPTIIAKDLTKTYLNGTQFMATFVKGTGVVLANTNVTFNINGVFYTRETNENGTATLNINLMPGKYVLTAIDPLTQLAMGYNVTVEPLYNMYTIDISNTGKNVTYI